MYLSSFVSSVLTTSEDGFFFIHKQYTIGKTSAALNRTLNEIDNDKHLIELLKIRHKIYALFFIQTFTD